MTQTATPSPSIDRRPARAVAAACVVCLLSLPLGRFFVASGLVTTGPDLKQLFASLHLFVAQDIWFGPATALTIALGWMVSGRADRPLPGVLRHPLTPAALAGLTALAAAALRLTVHRNYDLTLDEFIPAFQAEIFRNGLFFAPLPEGFFDLRQHLQPFFAYVDETHRLWGSGYRPVHAALLALLPASHATAVIHGALAGVSVLAMASIARQVFPRLDGAPVIASLLLVGTPQFLMTAASGFSFTAHLAFNLVWLALFLRGSWTAHGLAALIGALAIGLHQVHVHLLVVLPFALAMLAGAFGDRRKALPYLVLYTIALPVWVAWPEIAVWLQTGDSSVLPRSVLEIEYVADYLRNSGGFNDAREAFGYLLLIGDIARFVLWLSPALLPLVLLAEFSIRRMGLVPALSAAGLVLTVAVVHVLMPYQIHSWGSRYYHPVLGNVVILGLAGLAALPDGPARRRTMRATLVLCLAGLAVMVPLRAVQVAQKVGPRADLQAAIAALDTDAVIVPGDFWFAGDLVRNDPFLRNRPIMLYDIDPAAPLPGLPRRVVLDKALATALGRPSGSYLEP